jgi:hypothetical protein
VATIAAISASLTLSQGRAARRCLAVSSVGLLPAVSNVGLLMDMGYGVGISLWILPGPIWLERSDGA